MKCHGYEAAEDNS
jgi:hypothetical protein